VSVALPSAERWLGAYFNRPDHRVVDWRTWALCGDGCMMEGISNEAASLAGLLRLSKLCWIYDANRVSLEDRTEVTFTEDVATRFLGLGWNVLHVRDANDEQEVLHAFDLVKDEKSRPTLIVIESHIGYGAPHKHDSEKSHGDPLGEEEVKATKRFYGWPEDAQFLVPDGVYQHFADGIGARSAAKHSQWRDLFQRYHTADPKGVASRVASAQVENAVAQKIPWMIGGAADLAPSTRTWMTFEGAGDFQPG